MKHRLGADGPWTDRKAMDGHAVATAVITSPDQEILLVHHRLHRVWWPPGGHLEVVDNTLSGAALREAVEETGLDPSTMTLASPSPIDVEVTAVPPNPAKGEGSHKHLDFRYWFSAPRLPLHPQEDEVHDVAWRPISDLAAPRLVATLTAHLATSRH